MTVPATDSSNVRMSAPLYEPGSKHVGPRSTGAHIPLTPAGRVRQWLGAVQAAIVQTMLRRLPLPVALSRVSIRLQPR